MLFYALERLRGLLFPQVEISLPPDHLMAETDLEVRVRDGTILRANLYRPRAEGRYPVILSLHPYGKDILPRPGRPILTYRLMRQTGPVRHSSWTGWEAPDPVYWAERGYAVLNCDLRGFYRSEGQAVMLSEQEGLDYYDLIEWAAAQPWCNGKVGLSGVSYLCITQWRAAALRPPSLAAICAWEGFTSAYHDLAYPGGVREDGFIPFWFGKLDRRRVVENLRQAQLEHPRFDDYWASRQPKLEDIQVPALICASFSDHNLHSHGSFEAFRRISSTNKWLYTHRDGKWAAYYSEDALKWQTRFFDCFLKGLDNGMKEVPPVRLEVRRTRSQVHQLRAESQWPPASLREQVLSLGAARTHFPKGKVSFEHRFESDTELTGPMNLRLDLETDSELRLFAGLRKFSQGKEVTFEGSYGFGRDLVTRGYRRLGPGRDLVEVELLPSSTYFQAGDSIRLDLQGRYFFSRTPWGQFPAAYEVSPPGHLTVHSAELCLPVILQETSDS
ncbi:MAG: CocE/NonD family hydrolase [Candidatus Eremiobacteraeota bacterium]|nr:CocE/NonD family hydrolase [Candidatus Eremiobacteraeota bacterium]MCW5867240.1 CocE/NonD family hydrolase [Candidatus Eremiobacteraeota bacterium]